MIRKVKAMKEVQASYATTEVREVNIAGRQFLLRDSTPSQIRLLKRNVALYDKFAKHLEADHKGEYVAIGQDGALIVDANHGQVLHRAVEKFGPGKFAIWKIGYDYELKLR